MWYEYSQNNSGGSHVYDDNRGLSEWVFIEADSAKDADNHAEAIGIYFNGVDDDRDCDCCGDRWYRQAWFGGGDENGKDFDDLKETLDIILEYRWRNDGNAIYIHFKDGLFIGDKDRNAGELMFSRLKALG